MIILGEIIKTKDDFIDIYRLKFLKDNPRVYACTHGEKGFDELSPEEQQEIIYEKLLKEPSVKNLIPEIKRHRGLVESILVRWDTMEVIEGNSRLAAYRKLHADPKEEEDWELIQCTIVSSLTDDQQAAFLNQVHVKGKTSWSAFEKANFACVRRESGMAFKQIAHLFGESEQTIRTRVKIIQKMKSNGDRDLSHFSYYEVIVRNKDISKALMDGKLPNLLEDIKAQGSDDSNDEALTNDSTVGIEELVNSSDRFTAIELRKKLPVVLRKEKVLKKYQDRKLTLDEAYQLARISYVEENVKKATDLLDSISMPDISELENNAFNAFKLAVKRHKNVLTRVQKMTDQNHATRVN